MKKETPKEVVRTNLFRVPFENLKVLEGFNDREDYGTIEEMNELAESIYHQGVRVAITGYKDRGTENYVVIQGHRRVRAGEMIKKKYGVSIVYPMVIYPAGYSKGDLLLDTLISNSGKELTPLEKASTINKLMEEKVPLKKITAALGGVTEGYIKNLKKLWDIPEEGKKLIRNGTISASLIIGHLKSKGNMADFIAEIQAKLAELEAGGKKKGKVTKKNLNPKVSSVKLFKTFSVQDKLIFETEDKQAAFEFIVKLLTNKVTDKQIEEFFTGK